MFPCGYARCRLRDLLYDHEFAQAHRALSEKNVERLLEIFQIEGCKRTEEQNFVDAVISASELDRLHANAMLTSVPCDGLLDLPLTDLSIRCLSGYHRVSAAKRYLAPGDRWWIVRLFLQDTTLKSANLTHKHNNEANYTDGEVLYQIRLCAERQDRAGEARFWARLSASKRKDLAQFLRHEGYREALDKLLPWPAFWDAVHIGSFKRLLTMKCDEELQTGLEHVVKTWHTILAPICSRRMLLTVDHNTLSKLQGLCPRRSSADSALIADLMAQNLIFENLGGRERDIVLRRLLAVDTMIPSLWTYFENLKYLEPCAKIMRSICTDTVRYTIRESLRACYKPTASAPVQCGEHDLRIPYTGLSFDALYQQLWLFAMRNFCDLANVSTRKDADEIKPSVSQPNPYTWQRFAALCSLSGFHTPKIDVLCKKNARGELLVQLLEQCDVPTEESSEIYRDMLWILIHAPCRPAIGSSVEMTGHEYISIERRVGRPFTKDHIRDKKGLFLPQLTAPADHDKLNVTTFCCKWVMMRIFFEPVPDDISEMTRFMSESSNIIPLDQTCPVNLVDVAAPTATVLDDLQVKQSAAENRNQPLCTAITMQLRETQLLEQISQLEAQIGIKNQALDRAQNVSRGFSIAYGIEAGNLKAALEARETELARSNTSFQSEKDARMLAEGRINTMQIQIASLQNRLSEVQRDGGAEDSMSSDRSSTQSCVEADDVIQEPFTQEAAETLDSINHICTDQEDTRLDHSVSEDMTIELRTDPCQQEPDTLITSGLSCEVTYETLMGFLLRDGSRKGWFQCIHHSQSLEDQQPQLTGLRLVLAGTIDGTVHIQTLSMTETSIVEMSKLLLPRLHNFTIYLGANVRKFVGSPKSLSNSWRAGRVLWLMWNDEHNILYDKAFQDVKARVVSWQPSSILGKRINLLERKLPIN